MQSTYDKKLDEIIERFGYKAEPLADSKSIHNIVLELFISKCANTKTAIWGVGKNNTVNGHAAIIITKYVLELGSLTHLVDSNKDLQGKEFMGFPIIAPSQIIENSIELIIIASRASGQSIIESLQEVAPKCEYIDIYGELRKRGITIDYNFFSEQNVYTRLYQLKEEYDITDSPEMKEIILKELICRYLEIRDFYYAFSFGKVYCDKEYNDYQQFQQMQSEILLLIQKIKSKNRSRKNDVIIHLIDSLRAMDVYEIYEQKIEFKMFKAYRQYLSIFTEAYSTGPTTYESMLGIVKQKLSFEENVYDGNKFLFELQDFQLLQDILDQQMSIRFYVAKDYLIMEHNDRIQRIEHLHMTEKLWNVACDMAESEEATFNFIYYPWELHFPMICGFHSQQPQIRNFSDVGLEDMSDFIEDQFEDCKDYVDRQMEFYKDFFSDESTIAFLGDHSQPVFDGMATKPYFMYYREPDLASHVAFMVYGSKMNPQIYPQLISMLDFNTVLSGIVKSNKVSLNHREIIQYQYYNIQNKKLREAAKMQGYMDYTEGIHCFLSKIYLYARTATGLKEVYKMEEIKKGILINIADTKEGELYISQVEEQYDTSFPDFWTVRTEV